MLDRSPGTGRQPEEHMSALIERIKRKTRINPTDGLHRTAYALQWQYGARQATVGVAIGTLTALIFRTDILGQGIGNVLAAVGAVFTAVAVTTSYEADLQARRDTYRGERDMVLREFEQRIESACEPERSAILAQYAVFVDAGTHPNWHHATLDYRSGRSRELIASAARGSC